VLPSCASLKTLE